MKPTTFTQNILGATITMILITVVIMLLSGCAGFPGLKLQGCKDGFCISAEVPASSDAKTIQPLER